MRASACLRLSSIESRADSAGFGRVGLLQGRLALANRGSRKHASHVSELVQRIVASHSWRGGRDDFRPPLVFIVEVGALEPHFVHYDDV